MRFYLPARSVIVTECLIGLGVMGVLAAMLAVTLHSNRDRKEVGGYVSELRRDPMKPVVALLADFYNTIGQPIVIYIDDLDRCTSDYVVDLLKGIQTLLREHPFVYLIASDRKWICPSFEKVYADFGGSIGTLVVPSATLFLDKVFQVTASLPQISDDLADQSGASQPTTEQKQVAEAAVSGKFTQEELFAAVSSPAGDPLQKAAVRAAPARQITGTEAQHAIEHRLKRFAQLLEANPRSIKRLANAYSLHQATHLLHGRSVPAAALARWTMLELRWPVLTEFLTLCPDAAIVFADGTLRSNLQIPVVIEPLFHSQGVRFVATGKADELGGALNPEAIRAVLGQHFAPA
jgi:hypothetical protein